MALREWEWYENGKSYNNNLEPTYYDLVDCNWDFFYGFQWRNAGLNNDYPQPVFNYINKYVTFFVANIMSSKPALNFQSPITLSEDDTSDKIVNESWNEFVERVKLVWQSKNALYNGAVTGDYVGHLLMNPNAKPYNGSFSEVEGQIEFELIDPNNFYMGNANTNNVQAQPYIQIAGRDMVKHLKEEQKQVKKTMEDDLTDIQSDNDTEQQASYYGKIEMGIIESDEGNDNGKATYVITYRKKKAEGSDTKTVHATKCTQEGYIYKDVDLGIELYPVALGNWELQRNTYHGMSFVQAIIPAQIFINRGFAMAMKNTIDTSFPIFAYDKSMMGGKTNRVSTQIGLELRPGQSVTDAAAYIAPGNMSTQVINMIDLSKQFMAETVGANEALLGDVNPEQASGAAIAVASKQSGIPLENPKANLFNWWEDIGRIYYDMISNLYGVRPVLVTEKDQTVAEEFDFNTLKGLYKVPTIQVGNSGYWSEIAVKETLDNLLERQLIEFKDYVEEMPSVFLPGKDKLIKKLKGQIKADGETEDIKQEFLNSMTPEDRAVFEGMTPEQQEQILQQGIVENDVA